MSKNGCQCSDCACPAEAEITAAAGMSTVDHNHRRLPGVLRYRGLENEAVMAARLVKVESLVATLQSVLNDLDASMGVWVTPGIGAERKTDDCENDTPEYDAQRIALKHAQFVEGMLEKALAKIHAGDESADGHPIWENEQHFGARVHGTKRDMNDTSKFREERRA